MDPISIVTIVATAAKVIEYAGKAAYNLDSINSRWKDAPLMLIFIGSECRTMEQTITNIKNWIERNQEELKAEDGKFLDALSSCLIMCSQSVQRLQEDTEKVTSWRRFKWSLNNDTLQQCRTDLNMHVNAATNLWSTRNRLPSERTQAAEKVHMSLEIHFSRRSPAASSAGSILSDEPLNGTSTTIPFAAGISDSGALEAQSASQKLNVVGPVLNRKWFWVSISFLLASMILAYTFRGSLDIAADPVNETSKQDLLTAAGAGSSETVARLLKSGVKPSTRDPVNLWTPLHYAAANGSTRTIDLLLKYKDTGWFAINDMTPLHLAAKNGHTAAVQRILKVSGRHWDTERAIDREAIEKIKTATQSQNDNQFEIFLRRKTFTARELAVMYGHTNALLAFQSHSEGNTLHALSCACMIGNVDMVETLWNYISEPWFWQSSVPGGSQVRRFPAPPLHLAVMAGSQTTVAFLLERNLQANDQSANRVSNYLTQAYPPYSSPAHYAAMVGSVEILGQLERRKGDLTALDYRLRTPLSYAVGNLNAAAVDFLVQKDYPPRSGWIFGSRVTNIYLGSGHVWLDKKQKAAPIPNAQIRQALKGIGFSTERH